MAEDEYITTAVGPGNANDPAHPDAEKSLNWYELPLVVIAVALYILNYVLDGILLHEYWSNGYVLWFALTLGSLLLSTVLVQFMSLKMMSDGWTKRDEGEKISLGMKLVTILLHLLGLGLVQRHYKVFRNRLKARPEVKEQGSVEFKHFNKFLEQRRDVGLLGLFYSFLESGPQVTLQLFILLHKLTTNFQEEVDTTGTPYTTASGSNLVVLNTYTTTATTATNTFRQFMDHPATQIIKIVISLAGLTVALVGYNSNLRNSVNRPLSKWGWVSQAVYRFCIITSRILAFALFFRCVAWYWSVAVFLVIWILMICMVWISGWDYFTTGNKHWNRILGVMSKFWIGFVYVFCYIATEDGSQFWFMCIYYCFFYVVNVVLMVVAGVLNDGALNMVEYTSLAVCVVLMVLGIVFLSVYYQCVHPSRNREEGKCIMIKKHFFVKDAPGDGSDQKLTKNEENMID